MENGVNNINNGRSDMRIQEQNSLYTTSYEATKVNREYEPSGNKQHKSEIIDISNKTEDAVVLEISEIGRRAIQLKDNFEEQIVPIDNKMDYLPAYSGIYEADKAIASAVENCSKEEQAFVYNVIRQNFLLDNSGSMTEEERQANISLGMKKAEYVANNFISEDSKNAFLDAMETVAKLATAGKADASGNIDYGVKKGNYLGHGSNLVYTTDGLDMMRRMNKKAYSEYQKISLESSNADRALNTLKYMTNWYLGAVKSYPNMVDEYLKQSEKYIDGNVKDQKLDHTFADIRTDSKSAYLESLRSFQTSNPQFLSSVLKKELALQFWRRV